MPGLLARVVVLGLLLLAVPVLAQEAVVPEALRKQALEVPPASKQGWHRSLSLGMSFMLNQSNNVPGTPDGTAAQVGVLLDGAAERVHGTTTWANTLKIQLGETRTPLIGRFIKSADMLDASSTLLRRLRAQWLGAYGRVRLTTAMLSGYVVKPTAIQVKRSPTDAAPTVTSYAANENVPLTDPFEPFLLTQGIGLYATPTQSDVLTVQFKVGAGAQELIGRGGYALADDAKTPELELKQLRGAVQIGVEAEAAALGQLGPTLHWRAKAALFAPAWTSISGTPSGLGALSTDLAAGVSYKLSKWLALEYVLSARRVPIVVDAWQVTNGVVLALSLLR